MTPERKRELEAAVEEILGPPPKPTPKTKPKVVTSDGRAIRDAVVRVAPEDPNAKDGDRIVQVRREGWVTINMGIYELQRAEDEAARQRDSELYEASCRSCIWSNPNDY